MNEKFAESITRKNLIKAFAGETQAYMRYKFASEKAAAAQCGFIVRMLDFTADQEKEHARIFYNYLLRCPGQAVIEQADYPAECFDDIAAYLRTAQNSENNEADVIYPLFAETARNEGYEDIAFSFERIARIEKSHGDRFGCFAALLENAVMFRSDEETEWICLNCGNIVSGKDAPEKCAVCGHAQGFFVPYKYYRFVFENYTP